MRFRKRPVEVDAAPARQLIRQAAHDWYKMPEWVRDAYEKGGVVFTPTAIHIYTLEGVMKADFDDWVIRGVKGELYPCKPDIFWETYEEVIEPTQVRASGCEGSCGWSWCGVCNPQGTD